MFVCGFLQRKVIKTHNIECSTFGMIFDFFPMKIHIQTDVKSKWVWFYLKKVTWKQLCMKSISKMLQLKRKWQPLEKNARKSIKMSIIAASCYIFCADKMPSNFYVMNVAVVGIRHTHTHTHNQPIWYDEAEEWQLAILTDARSYVFKAISIFIFLRLH